MPRMSFWASGGSEATVSGCEAKGISANLSPEHTLLVTETGVEVLTGRLEDSPGGPIPMPTKADENGDGKKE